MKCLICHEETGEWKDEKYCSFVCMEKAVVKWQIQSKMGSKGGGKIKDIKLKGKEQIGDSLFHYIKTYKNPYKRFTDEILLEYATIYQNMRKNKGKNYIKIALHLINEN